MIWLAIFFGGGLGSMARFGISRLVLSLEMRDVFPWATLVSNVVASALLAYILFRFQVELLERPAARAFLAIGFCGGFSTFSTFSYENFILLRDGSPWLALVNILVSVIACTFFFYLAARTT